jgi:hypothetical protein
MYVLAISIASRHGRRPALKIKRSKIRTVEIAKSIFTSWNPNHSERVPPPPSREPG